jgi:hypothetical protein
MTDLIQELATNIILGCYNGKCPREQRDKMQEEHGEEVAMAAGRRAQYLHQQWTPVETH